MKYRRWTAAAACTIGLAVTVSGCGTHSVPGSTKPSTSANQSVASTNTQTTGNQAANGASGSGAGSNATVTNNAAGNTSNGTGSTNRGGTGANNATSNQTGNNAGASGSGTNPSSNNSTSGTTTVDQDLVPYNGPFQHIFFHPLIAFPSLAFNKKDPELKGFNDYFVTVSEFDKMLSDLYARNYVLVNINDLYTETKKNGKVYVHKNTLMLPKGKIPLVLSVDDMNYYPYMQQWGTVQKLVLDSSGNVAALSQFPDGHTAVTYDNAIVPILDNFVKQHPDFSLNGAKGMINLTGYAGVLGYRTNNTTTADYPQVKAQAEAVIQRLKQTGWVFSSHSWGHLQDANISYQEFVTDTNKWMQQVEPLIGPTQVYVYPFGSRVKTDGPKMQYLLKEGFHVFCGVGPTTYVKWEPTFVMMDRRHIDGIALKEQRKDLNDLFGTDQILDPSRPNDY